MSFPETLLPAFSIFDASCTLKGNRPTYQALQSLRRLVLAGVDQGPRRLAAYQ
jgi:hypothetical protein